MMGKRLFVIGSSDQFIPIIEEAHKMGLTVICADGQRKTRAKELADIRLDLDINDADAFAEAIAEQNADGVITGFSDKLLRLYAEACEKAGRSSYISWRSAHAATHKDELRKKCAEYGIPQARYAVLRSPGEADKAEKIGYPLVLKPNACYGGRQMYIVNDRSELERALPSAFEGMSEGVVTVEEYCEGQEIFVTCWIHDSQPDIVFTLDRLMWFGFPGRPGQTYANRIPSVYSYQYEAEFLDIAEKVTRAFAVENGTMTMQILVCRDGIKLIEPLMRLTGGSEQCVAKYLTDFDTEAELIRTAMGFPPDRKNIEKLRNRDKKKCAFYFPIVHKGGRVCKIIGFDDLKETFPFVLDANLKIREGDLLEAPNDMTQICGRVYGTGDTYYELEKNIRAVKSHLSILDENGEEMILNREELPR